MNISKTIGRFKRLFKPISSANQSGFIADCDEDFQECHNPWLSLSHLLSENQENLI